MKPTWQYVAVLLLLMQAPFAHAGNERRLVLVTDQATGIEALSTSEIRRLFLGLPVTKDGKTLEAVINQAEPLLYQVFLQKVVFMSAHVYERHLLENVTQLGGQRPQIFHDAGALATSLHQQPGKISYMWSSLLPSYPHLVVVGELWHSYEK